MYGSSVDLCFSFALYGCGINVKVPPSWFGWWSPCWLVLYLFPFFLPAAPLFCWILMFFCCHHYFCFCCSRFTSFCSPIDWCSCKGPWICWESLRFPVSPLLWFCSSFLFFPCPLCFLLYTLDSTRFDVICVSLNFQISWIPCLLGEPNAFLAWCE